MVLSNRLLFLRHAQNVMELVRRYHVTISGSVSTVVVTTCVLEGWASRLDETMDLMTNVRRFMSAPTPTTRFAQALDTTMAYVV